ncbi:hypothetical protein ABT369_22570 [Dactylosporangium sp. NPDC000244]|uniref:hypothetical protein n=1 Tax=Dactylosporangium sp. NPDC000244 TaxID=3154365 RepID=UPI00332AA2AD
MPRSLVTTALVGLVALVGTVACTGPASPAAPAPGPASAPATTTAPDLSTSFPYAGRPVGRWSSAEHTAAHAEVAIPGDRYIKVRARCSGSGRLTLHIRGKSFDHVGAVDCDGGWQYMPMVFPPAQEPIDPGPFPMLIDRADTITSWDVEALALNISNPVTPRAS